MLSTVQGWYLVRLQAEDTSLIDPLNKGESFVLECSRLALVDLFKAGLSLVESFGSCLKMGIINNV